MSDKTSLYLARGIVGNEGMLGAPLLHFQLSVDATTGSLSGHAWITQAVQHGDSPSFTVIGQLRKTGFRDATQIGSFDGTYLSPISGQGTVKVSAHFGVNDKWNGRGGFEYGSTRVEDVPVTVQG